MSIKKVSLRLPYAPKKEKNGSLVPSLDALQVGHKEVAPENSLRGMNFPSEKEEEEEEEKKNKKFI